MVILSLSKKRIDWSQTLTLDNKQIKFNEPFDTTLKRLEADEKFKSMVGVICEKAQVRPDDVSRALGGVYHSASLEHHGRNGEVVIDERDWKSSSERIALVALFRHCDIPFTYRDTSGNEVPCPYWGGNMACAVRRTLWQSVRLFLLWRQRSSSWMEWTTPALPVALLHGTSVQRIVLHCHQQMATLKQQWWTHASTHDAHILHKH